MPGALLACSLAALACSLCASAADASPAPATTLARETAAALPAVPEPAPSPRADSPSTEVSRPPTTPPLGATFHGPAGLIRTPNAEVLPEGRARLSFARPKYVPGSLAPDHREQWTVALGLAPGVEAGGAYNNFPARDITLHTKIQLRPERDGWPSIAIGGSNLRSRRRQNRAEPNYYLALTKGLGDGRARATVGVADGAIDGLFAGVEVGLTPWATALAEYDSDRLNAGLRLHPTPRVQIDLAHMRGGFGFQGAYSFDAASEKREAGPVELERPTGDMGDQELADAVAGIVAALGMENVRVVLGDGHEGFTVGIAYENRRYYRDELEALGRVLAAAAQALPERVERVSLLVLDHQVPVLRVDTPLDDYVAYLRGDMAEERFRKAVAVGHAPRVDVPPNGIVATSERRVSTRLTADISVTPRIRQVLGSEEVTLAIRHSLTGELDGDLGGGWAVRAAEEMHTGGHLPAGLDHLFPNDYAHLSHAFRAGPNLLGHVPAGDFADARRGVAAEGFWLDAGPSIVARGFAAYVRDGRPQVGRDYAWAYLGDLRYPIPNYDLEARLTFGKYLDGDGGYAASFRRYFGDNEISFTMSDTNRARILAVEVTVPIAPRRTPKPDPVRVRIGDRLKGGLGATESTPWSPGGSILIGSRSGRELRHFDLSDAFLNRDRFTRAHIRHDLGFLRSAARRSLP